ncbi:hypothetical protein KC939_02675 [Candidatus Saccharibacteria bacterium]|nr:hypothetical protein [Candidatus Saccharibacteria bacterium]
MKDTKYHKRDVVLHLRRAVHKRDPEMARSARLLTPSMDYSDLINDALAKIAVANNSTEQAMDIGCPHYRDTALVGMAEKNGNEEAVKLIQHPTRKARALAALEKVKKVIAPSIPSPALN